MEERITEGQHSPAHRRIGINAHLFAAEEGYRRAGVSRYIGNLLQHLLCEDPQGDYTVFVNPRNALSLPCQQKRSRLPTHNPWVRILWEQSLLPLELASLGIELLHSPVNIQPFFLPCRGVITVTDLSFMLFPTGFQPFPRLYQRIFTQLSARRATHCIAISGSTAHDLTRFCKVPAEKISITYPGVDAAYCPIRDAARLSEFRQQHNLPHKFFLFIGTLEPRKNLVTLLHAYATFKRETNSGHKLVLGGGKGWLYEPIFATVEKLGLQADVLFPGFIPEEELPLWYNTADAFVYPSLYEGFGLPPLEAMACGTPVVVSNASSLPEVVGDAGLLADPLCADEWAAALSRLSHDADLQADLAERGIKQAQKFSWTRMAQETIRVYQHALAGGA